MADFLANGLPLCRGTLTLPCEGAWVADVFYTEDNAPEVGTEVTLDFLGTSRIGTVIRSGNQYLAPRARIVGGKGKLETLLDPRDYRGYAYGRIAEDALQDAGEIVGDGWNELSSMAINYSRAQGSPLQTLRTILRLVGAGYFWRMSDDGKATLYKDIQGASVSPLSDLAIWPQEGRLLVAPLDTLIVPGSLVSAFDDVFLASRVTYSFGDELRAEVWYRG